MLNVVVHIVTTGVEGVKQTFRLAVTLSAAAHDP
jgi:hypothetical protein